MNIANIVYKKWGEIKTNTGLKIAGKGTQILLENLEFRDQAEVLRAFSEVIKMQDPKKDKLDNLSQLAEQVLRADWGAKDSDFFVFWKSGFSFLKFAIYSEKKTVFAVLKVEDTISKLTNFPKLFTEYIDESRDMADDFFDFLKKAAKNKEFWYFNFQSFLTLVTCQKRR